MRARAAVATSFTACAAAACVDCLRSTYSTNWHIRPHNNRIASDILEHGLEAADARGRERGRSYQRTQPLWPSLASLERDMTAKSFAPAERLPPELLPRDVAELQLSGRIPRKVLMLAEEDVEVPQTQHHEQQVSNTDPAECGEAKAAAVHPAEDDGAAALLDDMERMQVASVLVASPSAQSRSDRKLREAVLRDLSTNAIPSDSDEVVASWSAVGLDPELAARAAQLVGRGVTRAQSRLLPALLDDAHNDVLFGSVTGSGKTVAALLALLQGIRNETAGVNIFVASDAVNAQRAVDFVTRMGGPEIADCLSPDDYDGSSQDEASSSSSDWLMLADRRENHKRYYDQLLRSLERKQEGGSGLRLLVCTADALCELLFEHKLEFGPFGNLRRLMIDDVSKDMRFAGPTATFEEKQEELRNPSATQLLLATVHQLLPPHLRSLLQIGLVAADLESDLTQHLVSLCVKPQAHTVIACAARLPTTLHCVFSFYTPRTPTVSDPTRRLLEYLCQLLRNAAAAIPGRVLIFFDSGCDLVEMRALLRRHHGMDCRLLFEVLRPSSSENKAASDGSESSWQTGWRFLLLHEHEGFGLDIPLVSHVVMTFPPRNRFSFLHLAGRAARGGRPGWCVTIAPRTAAPAVAAVCRELDVDVVHNTVDARLLNVDPDVVRRWTAPVSPYSVLDPQLVVEERYQRYEDPERTHETMFVHNKHDRRKHFSDMVLEDYTPVGVLQRRQHQANQLRRDIALSPELAVTLARDGLVDPDTLKPTRKLMELFDSKSSAAVVLSKARRDLQRADPQRRRELARKIKEDARARLSVGVGEKTNF